MAKARAVAVTTSTLQGAVLFHDGQFEGRRQRVPVFLRRRPDEPVDRSLQDFYASLLRVLRHEDVTELQWQLCERVGWPDNQSYLNLVAWCLVRKHLRHLVVVNLSETPSQGRIRIPVPSLSGKTLRLKDEFSGTVYEREGHELQNEGLYVDLDAWRFHVLKF